VYGEWEETGGEVVIVYFMAPPLPLLWCTVSYTAELPYSRIQKIWSPGLLSLALKRTVFWVLTPCSIESQHFGGASILRVKVWTEQETSSSRQLASVGLHIVYL
jgi:hypothetical protein